MLLGGRITKQADVYSLGIVLWELATQVRHAQSFRVPDGAEASRAPWEASAAMHRLLTLVSAAGETCTWPYEGAEVMQLSLKLHVYMPLPCTWLHSSPTTAPLTSSSEPALSAISRKLQSSNMVAQLARGLLRGRSCID